MGNAGTLGQASGSGSIHDAEDVFWLRGVRLNHVLLAHLSKLLVCDDGEVGILGFELFNLAALSEDTILVDDDSLDVGLADGSLGGLEQMGVNEHGIGLCLDERVGKAVLTEGIVSSDDGEGLGSAGVGGGDPADAVDGFRLVLWVKKHQHAGLILPGGSEQMKLVLGSQAELP